eukprot:746293-Hanusia_phi.AAC.6
MSTIWNSRCAALAALAEDFFPPESACMMFGCKERRKSVGVINASPSRFTEANSWKTFSGALNALILSSYPCCMSLLDGRMLAC